MEEYRKLVARTNANAALPEPEDTSRCGRVVRHKKRSKRLRRILAAIDSLTPEQQLELLAELRRAQP
jgi:hypothetical protein